MLRILIAEDEPLEQQSLKDILEWNFSCGVDIKTASNGVDAISTATIWHADLVLMDIEMPGCNGIVAANKIAKVNPLTKFIIITAYERFEYAHEAVRLHAVDYLLKPVEDAVLVSTIQRLIQEREEENALQQRVLEVQAPSQELTSQTRSELLIKNVEDYIRKNYRYDISQEIICDILNMSTGHFSKLFRQYYGVKFIDFLTNIRVEAAKELLLDPTKRTKEIGEMVGYPSSSYFSTLHFCLSDLGHFFWFRQVQELAVGRSRPPGLPGRGPARRNPAAAEPAENSYTLACGFLPRCHPFSCIGHGG